MIEINGKDYKINLDVKWGTQKLMRKINKDRENPDNQKYLEYIVRDILVPPPSKKEMMEFRNSDVERIFTVFAEIANNKDKEFKKKLSS